MAKLSERNYWNSLYRGKELAHPRSSFKDFSKILIEKVFGEKFTKYMRNYAGYLIWDIIYTKYLPKTEGKKILDIGSAPGYQLVRFSKTFGFIPYGIDYSESGVEVNKKVFISNNLNPDNVIYADFLSEEFHNHHKEYFDIVVSKGFIEHFTDVDQIVQKHINLLKKGGYLVISIPNLRGLNYVLKKFFYKEDLMRHNLNIMEKEKFAEVFRGKSVLPLYCNYCGTLNFELFNVKKGSRKRFLLNLLRRLQLILNILFRLILRDNGAESRLFSPYLIFIGVKKE